MEEYWKNLEKEIGEEILGYSLGNLHTPIGKIPAETYCLFYITPTRLFIRYLPNPPSILSIPLGRTKEEVQTLGFNLEDLQELTVQLGSKGWAKWFSWISLPLARVTITIKPKDSTATTFSFSMESKNNEFLRHLLYKSST